MIFLVRSFPFLMPLVHVHDMIPDLHYAVHIVGIDHRGDINTRS